MRQTPITEVYTFTLGKNIHLMAKHGTKETELCKSANPEKIETAKKLFWNKFWN